MKDTARFGCAVVTFLALAAVSAPAEPATRSCKVVAQDETRPASIRADETEQTVKAGSLEVRNCSVEVRRGGGGVYLLYWTKTGDRKRRPCEPGETCQAEPEAKNVLAQVFAGAPGFIPGGKRMDKDVQQLEGLPAGRIYSLERAGTFDFAAAGIGQWAVVVTEVGVRAPLFQRSGNEPVLRLSPGLFRRGGKYVWTVETGPARYSGGFDILGAGEAGEVEQDLQRAGITGPGRTRAEKLDELMILFDYSLDYEARLLYRELKL
jgi:hypothetical protein